MRIEPFTLEHLASVARLEEIGGDAHWSEGQFRQELDMSHSRIFVILADQPVQVESSPGVHEVVAYGGFWSVAGEAQMTNIVVHPQQRRQGLGRRLLEHLLATAKHERCQTFVLEVRATNHAAQQLYAACGFKPVGRRPNFYQSPTDDAILMEKQL